jgi:hypothetical protein
MANHLPLFERTDWRYAFLMGGRGNGRSGTASRYAVTRLLGKEYDVRAGAAQYVACCRADGRYEGKGDAIASGADCRMVRSIEELQAAGI